MNTEAEAKAKAKPTIHDYDYGYDCVAHAALSSIQIPLPISHEPTPPTSFTSTSSPTSSLPASLSPTSPITLPPVDEKPSPSPCPSRSPSLSPSSNILPIIADIRRLRAGALGIGLGLRGEPQWRTYNLERKEYDEFWAWVRQDKELGGWIKDKLRYSYFPDRNRFVIRMPTTTHERFIAKVSKEITRQLDLSESPFAQDIEASSDKIKPIDPTYGAHFPDLQFKHAKAQFPGVVIEVSYSQKYRDLPHLADAYILGTDGNVNLVVALDIAYGRRGEEDGNAATISVWKADGNEQGELYARCIVDKVPFCLPSGGPSLTCPPLHIPLSAFAPEACHPNPTTASFLEDKISIPATTLCRLLKAAEDQDKMINATAGKLVDFKWTGKRKRQITPPEELEEKDEKRFKREEEVAQDQADNPDQDKDFILKRGKGVEQDGLERKMMTRARNRPESLTGGTPTPGE